MSYMSKWGGPPGSQMRMTAVSLETCARSAERPEVDRMSDRKTPPIATEDEACKLTAGKMTGASLGQGHRGDVSATESRIVSHNSIWGNEPRKAYRHRLPRVSVFPRASRTISIWTPPI